MIQLIAADLDGTLLDSNKRLSPDLFPLIRTLGARGVRFAAASGRQVDNLRALFAPLAGEMLLIAENGAAVYDGPRCLFADQLPAAYFFGPIRTVRTLPGVGAVLCTHEGAFIEAADDPVFVQNARMYYEKLDVVPDLLAVLARIPRVQARGLPEGPRRVRLLAGAPGVCRPLCGRAVRRGLGRSDEPCNQQGDGPAPPGGRAAHPAHRHHGLWRLPQRL